MLLDLWTDPFGYWTDSARTFIVGGSPGRGIEGCHGAVLRALEAGATDFLSKPFDFERRMMILEAARVRDPRLRDELQIFFATCTANAMARAGSVGRTVLWNLISNPFGGGVYPVNANRPSVLGIKAYPKLANLPEKPDLVVVTTPAAINPHSANASMPTME